jgi:hypothetical protein
MPSEMPNYNEKITYILGLVFIVLVFSLAYAYLKPHRFHKSKPVSTFILKASYLFYLVVVLIIIYLSALVRGGLDKVFFGEEFFAFLAAIVLPTTGIFARRLESFSRKRDAYNYFFSAVNLVCVAIVLIMYFI